MDICTYITTSTTLELQKSAVVSVRADTFCMQILHMCWMEQAVTHGLIGALEEIFISKVDTSSWTRYIYGIDTYAFVAYIICIHSLHTFFACILCIQSFHAYFINAYRVRI